MSTSKQYFQVRGSTSACFSTTAIGYKSEFLESLLLVPSHVPPRKGFEQECSEFTTNFLPSLFHSLQSAKHFTPQSEIKLKSFNCGLLHGPSRNCCPGGTVAKGTALCLGKDAPS